MSCCTAEGCCGNSTHKVTPWWQLVLAGLLALTSEIVGWLPAQYNILPLILALAAIAISGTGTYKAGFAALRRLDLNMNALMTIAVTGAIAIGEWPEAAMVMVLFTVAERLEGFSLDRAKRAISRLMVLAPEKATVQQPDGSWQDTETKTVQPGSIVRLKPGERIALDGMVLSGISTVNQAPITGESLPVKKTAGDQIFAGTINLEGSLEYRTTTAAGQSTLARIIKSVEGAQASRAPVQRAVDKFARIYTPLIFVIALGVAILPPLLNNGNGWTEWLYRALVLLVIACPCALVISTPVSIMSGLAAAARKGILIKGGVYLETGRSLKWLALDKTGTLTNGNPVQTAFYPWEDNDPALARNIAAKLAGYSDHPVSRAVCQANTVDLPLSDPEEFTALPGRGVRGTINGILYHLGNYELMQELGYSSDQLETKLHELETTGASTAILAGTTSGVMALFGLADTLRKTSRKAIDELHSLGVQTVILTGDNSAAAQIIARQAGVNRVHYGLLPEDKLKIVAELSSEGAVGMVGDGINDAPALAGSTIGFAMGAAGSDIAIETSDVALMDDDLCKIPAFIRLSRNTMRVLRQNMILALGAKLAFLLLAVNGDATMWMAVFADMGISLLVVGNGLRLLRQ